MPSGLSTPELGARTSSSAWTLRATSSTSGLAAYRSRTSRGTLAAPCPLYPPALPSAADSAGPLGFIALARVRVSGARDGSLSAVLPPQAPTTLAIKRRGRGRARRVARCFMPASYLQIAPGRQYFGAPEPAIVESSNAPSMTSRRPFQRQRFEELPELPRRPHPFFAAEARSVSVETEGFGAMDVSVRVHGDGPPLLLVHGLMTSGYSWRYLLEPLGRRDSRSMSRISRVRAHAAATRAGAPRRRWPSS